MAKHTVCGWKNIRGRLRRKCKTVTSKKEASRISKKLEKQGYRGQVCNGRKCSHFG